MTDELAIEGGQNWTPIGGQDCRPFDNLAVQVQQNPLLELKAPVALNIVCFGVRGTTDGALNREIVMDVQEAGIAAPSWTTINGEQVIRCAIVNHRTTRADIDRMLNCVSVLAKARVEAIRTSTFEGRVDDQRA